MFSTSFRKYQKETNEIIASNIDLTSVLCNHFKTTACVGHALRSELITPLSMHIILTGNFLMSSTDLHMYMYQLLYNLPIISSKSAHQE